MPSMPNLTFGGPTSEASSSLSPILPLVSPTNKRRRLSDERAETNDVYKPYGSKNFDPWHAMIPELAFTEADVAALIQKGKDQAARIIEDINHRKELIRQSKDDQISRHISQLREVQDQLAIERGQGPYAQEMSRRDNEIDSLRAHVSTLTETIGAREARCTHLEQEYSDLKARYAELEKRDDQDAKIAGANSPPSTPISSSAVTIGSIAGVGKADMFDELAHRIDATASFIKKMRAALDTASISQIFQNIDELDLLMAFVVQDKDKLLSSRRSEHCPLVVK